MVEAIARGTERAESFREFLQDAREAEAEVLRTGKSYDAEEVFAYLVAKGPGLGCQAAARQEVTVQLSPRALADLERILEFIAEHDPALETLNDYLATITNVREAVRILVPDLHRSHDGLRGRAAVRLGVNAPAAPR